MEAEKPKITFKSLKRKKPLRHRENSDEDEKKEDDEESIINKDLLAETLEIQKLRKRSHGVNAITLAMGKKISKVDELVNNDGDPFKLKSGGLLSLDGARKAAAIIASEDLGEEEEEEKIVGTVFSKETRIRDEDEEMRKFIESEVEKRRGKPDDSGANEGPAYLSPEELALMSLPEHLKKTQTKKSEEMLSSQMLSGIPEVDLGIDEKIRNIEATEFAKKKAAEERGRLKVRPSEFVPTNLAVNFKQPNRFKTDDDLIRAQEHRPATNKKLLAEKLVTQRTVVVGQMPEERQIIQKGDSMIQENDPVRATDDVHVQKFKKHFQRK
jgi:hypothetical protein